MATRLVKHCLILFQGRSMVADNRSIHRGVVSHIQKLLDKAITSAPEKTEIELWLDSPGGDAHSAYKLVLDLRNRCKKLTAVVPDFAKSAATLLLLGVDEIHMAAAAELGPLDVQISHPDRENQVVSGLDVSGSLTYLSKFAMNLMLTGGAAVVETTELPRIDVLKSMQTFTAKFLQPCVSKLDPHLTRRAVYQLKVAERYALELLMSRNMPDDKSQMRRDAAERMVTELVNDYPVHEFVISRSEARKLELPIIDAEKHPNWPIIQSTHRDFVRGEKSIIYAAREDELLKQFQSLKPTKLAKGIKTAKPKAKTGGTDGQPNKNSRATKAGSNGTAADIASRL